ncbi:peptidylprolyl isomerase [Geomonas limicola]|uniref:Peptidylprolyl isomerase n=1 Tax=Geomonas limicola TaxID=2740186 RepID=A0A6V8NC31_9BACT|nr:peptidylprolyl isomerase [Geomonas limicola]GFO69103.1 peptidylprolyl isomerase [Geomonas limicola]
MSLRKTVVPLYAALCLALSAAAAFAQDAPAPAAEPAKTVAAPAAKAETKSPSDPVARVNGTTITRLELDRAMKVMLAQNQVDAAQLTPEQLKQGQDVALDQLIAAELLLQEASKHAVKDLDKLVDDKIAVNRAKFSSDADFQKALSTVDMSVNDMKDFTRKDIVISSFIESQYAAKVVVSDADAKKFYDENLEKYFSKPESARASHILIGVDDKASAEDRKKAKEKAQALLKRVKDGEDFATVAKAESSCPSASQGGDLGTFGHGQMVAPFEEAAFALKPGQISDVVETQFGYHIIKLTEKQEGGKESFESVKEKITEFLKREKTQKSVVDLVSKLRETGKIEKL